MAIITNIANLFELSCDDVTLTYSTSSFAGPPQLTYSGPDGDHSFSGDQIDSASGVLGTEVSVTLEVVPDLHTITLTLLLPSLRLTAGAAEAAFDTIAIRTTTRSTIAGAPAGADRSYETIGLHGVAKAVEF